MGLRETAAAALDAAKAKLEIAPKEEVDLRLTDIPEADPAQVGLFKKSLVTEPYVPPEKRKAKAAAWLDEQKNLKEKS